MPPPQESKNSVVRQRWIRGLMHWGRRDADPSVDKIRFKDNADLATYNADLAIIKEAGQEQLRLQTTLVNQPVNRPTD